MLVADGVVVEALRLLLGERQDKESTKKSGVCGRDVRCTDTCG